MTATRGDPPPTCGPVFEPGRIHVDPQPGARKGRRCACGAYAFQPDRRAYRPPVPIRRLDDEGQPLG